jgi:hypothetical protein
MSEIEFSTGMEHMLAAIAEGQRRAAGGGGFTPGSALNYLKWEAGEKKVLRFLADDMITADFYDFILTADGKTQNFMVDPNDPGRLDRYRSATPGIGWRKPFNSSTLEEPKLTKRGVCVAVLREEIRDAETSKLQTRDYLYDREFDGKTYPSRYFVIVQQGINNFWRPLAALHKRYGSLATIDIEITREGADKDTIYSPIPLPEDPALADKQAVLDFYFYGQPWDPNDEQRFLKCPQTTKGWAQYFSGEERYRRYLAPNAAAPSSSATSGGLGEFHPATTANPVADEAQAMATSGTTFDSLADTLLKKAKG